MASVTHGRYATAKMIVWTHKDRIDMATADLGRDGEVRHVGSISGDLVSLDKALRKMVSKGHRLHVVYEAGPCGFVIWRHLNTLGTSCDVVAPSSIPRRSGERIKTDRRDAMNLARLDRSGELTEVRFDGQLLRMPRLEARMQRCRTLVPDSGAALPNRIRPDKARQWILRRSASSVCVCGCSAWSC